MRKWKCLICKYLHEGDAPPDQCPVCKAPASKFVEAGPAFSEADAAGDAPAGESRTQTNATPLSRKSKILDGVADLLSRRHAHPISVHFPNGILPVALMMFLLAWLFDAATTATAGFYNIVFVTLALPIVIFTGSRDGFVMMVEYTAPVFWFFLLLVGASIFLLRRRRPADERPFRVPLYPLTPLLFCAICAYMLHASLSYTGRGALVGVGVLLAGLPLIILQKRMNRRISVR
jgi:hypothetical protein